MPAPTMPPMTIIVASNNPSWRRGFDAVVIPSGVTCGAVALGEGWRNLSRVISKCHSERSEAATQPRKLRGEARLSISDQIRPEMFESLASCFAFRCSAPLNMTAALSDARLEHQCEGKSDTLLPYGRS